MRISDWSSDVCSSDLVPTLPTNAACPRASSMPTHSSPMRTPPDPVGDLLDSARLVTKSWQGRTAKARFQALLALESAGPPARAGRDEYNPLRLIRARGPAIYSPASRFLLFSDDYAARLSFSGLFDNMKIQWVSGLKQSTRLLLGASIVSLAGLWVEYWDTTDRIFLYGMNYLKSKGFEKLTMPSTPT